MAIPEDPASAPAQTRLGDEVMVGVWELDPRRSNAHFQVKHFWGMVTVRGQFTKFRGTATIDRAGAISGSMHIDAASVATRQSKRDAHLRSADFFDADNHPTISFSTQQVTARGDDRVAVVGELTAAGRTRPITFEARITGIDASAERLTADAEITLDRTEFGMTWSSLGMASSTVLVTVQGELVRSRSSEASGTVLAGR